MNKKSIINIITIIFIGIIFFSIYKIFTEYKKTAPISKSTINTVPSDTGFKVYSIDNLTITDPNANLIFLDDIGGSGQKELKVSLGSTYSFKKYGEHTIKVLELDNNYITISIDRLAPTKETGGFSLVDRYDKVTIKKNTGICLNIQATDTFNGSVYFFYINK